MVPSTHSIGHFGEISGNYSDYRNVNMIILYNLLGITPSVVIITDLLKMEGSYIRVGICYDSPRYTIWYYAFYQYSLYRTQPDLKL